MPYRAVSQSNLSSCAMKFFLLSIFLVAFSGCSGKQHSTFGNQVEYTFKPEMHLEVPEEPDEPKLSSAELEARGDALLQQGKFPLAFAQYDKALGLDPGRGRPDLHVARGIHGGSRRHAGGRHQPGQQEEGKEKGLLHAGRT